MLYIKGECVNKWAVAPSNMDECSDVPVPVPAPGPAPAASAAAKKRITVRQRRLLMQRIHDLGQTEHQEIFNILQKHGVEHTQNSNGVFINLTPVADNIVAEVQRFVNFCFDNKRNLDEYDKRLNECKLSQNFESISAYRRVSCTGGNVAAADDGGGAGDSPAGAAGDVADDVPVETAPATTEDVVPSQPVTVQSLTKRILNSKYHLAKKKFGKRRVAERVCTAAAVAAAAASAAADTAAGIGELVPEPYIVLTR